VLGSYGTPDGRRVNFSYTGDPLVRLMDDPSSGHHSYGYTAGPLTQYLPASGAGTAYHYDSSGRVDAVTAADGSTAAETQLPDGRVSAIGTSPTSMRPRAALLAVVVVAAAWALFAFAVLPATGRVCVN